MRIPLDRDSPDPLYRQIQRFIQKQIQSGALPAETRLPSSRDLSSSLGVSRITVINAYAELEAEGLVTSHTGSGTYVASHLSALPDAIADSIPPGDWPPWQQELLSRTWLPAQRELTGLVASLTHPDHLGVLATDIDNRSGVRKKVISTHAVAGDLGDLFVRQRNGDPSVTRGYRTSDLALP